MLTALCYGISFLVYVIILLWGMFGNHSGEYFGYCLFSFYFIIPAVSFVGAFILSSKNTLWKWVYPVLFGVLGFAIPIVVFKRMAQMPIGLYFIPSLIGLAIGLLMSKVKNKNFE